MASIIPLDAVDPELVEQLLDESFGEDRKARTAYRIREGCHWLEGLSFAALDDDNYLAATIQLWPVALATPKGRGHPLLMVGPVAVLPGLQGQGFGKALMAASLGAIDAMAHDRAQALPQVLIGDPEYYGNWGFSAEHTGKWHCPGPFERERLLLRCENPAVLPDEGMLGPWAG
ncbi:GNAT family N-acetyltransferase [Qipengyuania sp. CAU 1752]